MRYFTRKFIGRRQRTRKLKIGSMFEGIPVVENYRYLDLYLDSKLTVHTHLSKLKEKILYQAEALAKVIFNFSAGYRKILWMVLIKPLFDFPAMLLQMKRPRQT